MIADNMALPKAPAPVPSARGPAWRTSRRQLLKTGLAGTCALAAAGWATGWAGGWTSRSAWAAAGGTFIRAQDEALARAVIQAFVGWALPADPSARKAAVEEALGTADAYFASFTPAVQAEAQQAFDLLNIGLVRWLVAGVSNPWESASAQQVNGFLESFRTSRFAMLRQIFQLLEGVATVGWYGQRASWAALGYPGPPQFNRPTGEKPL
jgi:hypothetical protein